MVQAGDRRELEAILELASGIEESGKGTQLGRMLAAHPGKAVVFSEFVPTLDHLRRICGATRNPLTRYSAGHLPRAEKDAAIAIFPRRGAVCCSPRARAVKAANLQFADTIVNFDLPWSPMRLEQRVGRVHRIGQTRDVFVFNSARLDRRGADSCGAARQDNMFELVIGEMDAILGTRRHPRLCPGS